MKIISLQTAEDMIEGLVDFISECHRDGIYSEEVYKEKIKTLQIVRDGLRIRATAEKQEEIA